MKKLLAIALSMLMALSMVACNEKDDKDDKDVKDSSSVVDSSSKDDSSKEDESSKDDSSEEDSSENDSKSDRPSVEISENAQGELVDGVAIAGNLSLKLDETWTTLDYEGSVVFYPAGYEETGNNLNIMVTEKDEQLSEYTKENLEEGFALFFGDDFELSNFKSTKIDGNDAILLEYDFSDFHFLQIMISAPDEGYTLTFTSSNGSFVDADEICNAITIK